MDKLPTPCGLFGALQVRKFYEDKGVVPNWFSLQEVSETEVLKLLYEIDRNKTTGLDNLPAWFVCDAASAIKGPVSHIINISITHGVIPKNF